MLELELGTKWVGGRAADGDSTLLALDWVVYTLQQQVFWVVVVNGRMPSELDAAGIGSYSLRTWCGIWSRLAVSYRRGRPKNAFFWVAWFQR